MQSAVGLGKKSGCISTLGVGGGGVRGSRRGWRARWVLSCFRMLAVTFVSDL